MMPGMSLATSKQKYFPFERSHIPYISIMSLLFSCISHAPFCNKTKKSSQKKTTFKKKKNGEPKTIKVSKIFSRETEYKWMNETLFWIIHHNTETVCMPRVIANETALKQSTTHISVVSKYFPTITMWSGTISFEQHHSTLLAVFENTMFDLTVCQIKMFLATFLHSFSLSLCAGPSLIAFKPSYFR